MSTENTDEEKRAIRRHVKREEPRLDDAELEDLLNYGSIEEFNALRDGAIVPEEDNYLLIEMSWGNKIIFPWKAGIEFMDCLKQAEGYDTEDFNHPRIAAIETKFEARVISRKEYVTLKLRTLLRLNKKEPDE
jgi:hypothetical protein